MIRSAAVVTLSASLLLSSPGSAHCDTTKGPVVTAARAALDAGDLNLVLHWVRPEDEAVVRSAFQHTREVRALGPEAKALADRYFFETVVRIHRAGEGAPYTGLTDAEPEPIIAATDRALERGTTEELEPLLVSAVKTGLADRFAEARAARSFRQDDVAAGRAFVGAYVPLTHWVEGVFNVAKGTGEHDAIKHPAAVHAADSHAERAAAGEMHGGSERQHVPWILTGLLAIAAAVEAAFLVRRRRHAAA